MTDKILKIAKRLKTFTLEDIVMFTGLEIDTVRNFLDQSDNIQKFKNEFEYVGIIQKEETFKIIDKKAKSLCLTIIKIRRIIQHEHGSYKIIRRKYFEFTINIKRRNNFYLSTFS